MTSDSKSTTSPGPKGSDLQSDLVLFNGNFHTINTSQPNTEAVVIRNGRFAFVGSNENAKAFASKDAQTVDMQGRFVTPGYVDAHMHPAAGAFRYAVLLRLFGVHAENHLKAYQEALAEYAASNPDRPWIQGAGFRRSVFDEIGPRKEWLDQIISDKPVAISSKDGHSMWVNSKALEKSGITANTPDPLNGLIQRDPETGEPTGLLQESAMNLVLPHIPKATKDEIKESLLWLQGWLNEKGITTAHEAILELDAPEVWQAYQELAEEGRLTVRYRASWRMDPDRDYLADIEFCLKTAEGFNTPYFQAKSFKFFADEVVEEETAYLIEAYSHRDDDFYGLKDWDSDALRVAFTKIHQAGGQVHIHAIGDGAARYAIDALIDVEKETGITGRRPNLAHLQMIAPDDIRKMADIGAVAVVSPYWAVIDDYFWELFLPYLGHDRCFSYQYPLKSFFDAGVVTAVHSDFSVTEPHMARAVYSAVTRRAPKWFYDAAFSRRAGYSWAPDKTDGFEHGEIGALPPVSERIGIEEVLRASTLNGAYANFLENDLGSIEVGKLADLAVWDRDLFGVDVEEIAEARIVSTFFEGRLVLADEASD